MHPHSTSRERGGACSSRTTDRSRRSAPRGDVFERVHDAELVHEAVLEHETRAVLKSEGRRAGAALDAEVARVVEGAMREVRGSWGRPSDEYPKDARVELTGLRVILSGRVASENDDDHEAVTEAAEEEAAPPRRGQAA